MGTSVAKNASFHMSAVCSALIAFVRVICDRRCSHTLLRLQGRSGHFHGLPYDGRTAGEGTLFPKLSPVTTSDRTKLRLTHSSGSTTLQMRAGPYTAST